MKQTYLEIGRILSTHGLVGEVNFEHWGDDEKGALSLKTVYTDPKGLRALKVRRARMGTKHILFTFDGIDNVDAAALLRMKTLWARREDLAKDDSTVFWADLIGEEVRDEKGIVFGKIRDIYNRGASDIWEIETDKGERILFPAAPVFVKEVTCEGAVIAPPEGLF
ncbi:MAG: 16S rRNA processing protein RimM [Clostridia bacterium]|nr:16S rRNA processing protein RimM [Clostridia bacterium]